MGGRRPGDLSEPKLRQYLVNYAAHTDERVKADPAAAVGGMWDELGIKQLMVMRSLGLRPEDYLLDIGCGTLRAGRHFIEYLRPARYFGTEMSAEALGYAALLIEREGLSGKLAMLELTDGSFDFSHLHPPGFDYALAHSVFTHLPMIAVAECFEAVLCALKPGGQFAFTYYRAEGSVSRRTGFKSWFHLRSDMEATARRYQMGYREIDYDHPRGQVMGVAARRPR